MVSGGISKVLTDKACRAFANKNARGDKLSAGGGLYLFITSPGCASWRIKYRIEGKEKTYSIGAYPTVSLASAHVELSRVKTLLLEGKDPVTERRLNRAATAASADNTFQAV